MNDDLTLEKEIFIALQVLGEQTINTGEIAESFIAWLGPAKRRKDKKGKLLDLIREMIKEGNQVYYPLGFIWTEIDWNLLTYDMQE